MTRKVFTKPPRTTTKYSLDISIENYNKKETTNHTYKNVITGPHTQALQLLQQLNKLNFLRDCRMIVA